MQLVLHTTPMCTVATLGCSSQMVKDLNKNLHCCQSCSQSHNPCNQSQQSNTVPAFSLRHAMFFHSSQTCLIVFAGSLKSWVPFRSMSLQTADVKKRVACRRQRPEASSEETWQITGDTWWGPHQQRAEAAKERNVECGSTVVSDFSGLHGHPSEGVQIS